jgi:hypothetical protein
MTDTNADRARFPGAGAGPLALHPGLALRSFGDLAEDLELDLGEPNRPLLVTRLLHACAVDVRRLDVDVLWELSVGDRLRALLHLAALVDDRPAPVQVICAGCAQTLEAELSLRELAALGAEADPAQPVEIRIGDERVRLRRPTGADQLRWWLAANETGPREMIEELRVERTRPIPIEWLPQIDDAMAEADPLVDFRVRAVCPDCSAVGELAVDLEELMLKRLRRARARLLSEIHRLAMAYHWSERQILALPAWRRQDYLALVERSAG